MRREGVAMMRMPILRRRWVGVGVGLGGCLAVAAVSVAFAAGGGPATYTGCLSSTGVMSKVRTGSTPVGGSCPTGSSTIRLSSGDITSVAAGPGLVGGAAGGAATLGMAPGYTPHAINIDIAQTNPATIDVATLPGGFELRLACMSGADPRAGQDTIRLDALSMTDGDANFTANFTHDGVTVDPLEYGISLPAGTFQFIAGTYVSPGTSVRFDGQLVLHAGSNVTAVTFHQGVDATTGDCQIIAVATTGH
jgi:hypothetical protein